MARAVGTRVDHYELVDHLASGAQAEVHQAEDLTTGYDVVVRFPHDRVLTNPVLAARWRREIKITERLFHPHLLQRLDLGERHAQPYMVLEYAPGGSLDKWVAKTPTLPIGQAVRWGRQLALALSYLHEEGIIHRDLKPGNVMLTADLDAKLGDFGAATAAAAHRRWLAFPEVCEGTPEYLSPEQVTGRPGDERSDLYAWGIVMYELLTGRVPHTGADPYAVMHAHLRNDVVPIRELRPEVPPNLEAIVLTALRRRPEHRYQCAFDLLVDLDDLDRVDLTDQPPPADPPLPGSVGGSEAPVLVRFVLVVAAAFMAVVAAVLCLTIALQ